MSKEIFNNIKKTKDSIESKVSQILLNSNSENNTNSKNEFTSETQTQSKNLINPTIKLHTMFKNNEIKNLSSIPSGYSPNIIKAAYNIDKIPTDGSNQTIAIISAYNSPNIISDFKTFDSYYKINNPSALTVYSMSTSTIVDSGWALEASMDTQWVHAIAPKAKILLVQAKSASFTDMFNAVNYANNNGATIVSMSWGSTEFSTQNNYDIYFSKSNVSYLASSGDTGGIVNWPSSSSKVLSVGGTSLNMNGTSRIFENAWNGAGGGISSYVNLPSYQNVLGGTKRQCPDLSCVADPNYSGLSVYCSTPNNGSTGWFGVGGTSASVLIIAGLIALINNARDLNGKQNLSTNIIQSFIYSLTSGNLNYSYNFFDIINGLAGNFIAKKWYDNITGLGSPNSVNTVSTSNIVILNGTINPTNTIGIDSNYYINYSTGDYFCKVSGSWILKGNITGSTIYTTQTTVGLYFGCVNI